MSEKIIIFGTGKYYQIYHKWIEPSNIIALVDNNSKIQGNILEGHKIISPMELSNYDYDRIYILSISLTEIREQLTSLGVPKEKIYCYFQLRYKKDRVEKKYYPQNNNPTNIKGKRVIMISHDLSITGAPKCLLMAARMLIKDNYPITVASPYDGKLKKDFISIGADVIIDERLRTGVIADIEWIRDYDVLFVNTVQLYYLLRKRDLDMPTIWWIHEPEILYKSVLPDIIGTIEKKNLKLYTVGKVAEAALLKIWPDVKMETLVYGIPDSKSSQNIKKKTYKSKMRFIIIGALSKLKGHDILLHAISELEQKEKDESEFLLVGKSDTAYGAKIVNEIKRLKLPIMICGEMENKKVLQLLDKSDVLICVSRVESMSIAVTEGLMKGMPIIVSSAAGIVEYIRDRENGLIFESENVIELRNKISFCMKNRRSLHKIAKKGRETYLDNFSLDSFEKRLKAVMENDIGVPK